MKLEQINFSKGFTLIEVLVALTIFTVSAVAVSTASINFINTTEKLRDKTLAHFVAKNRMADVVINNEWVTQEKIERVVNENGRRWQIHQTNVATESENLMRVELSIAPISEGGETLNPITDFMFMHAKPLENSATNN